MDWIRGIEKQLNDTKVMALNNQKNKVSGLHISRNGKKIPRE